MTKIKNMADLQVERMRLRSEIIMQEEQLKEDFVWVKEELEPGRIIGRLFGLVGNKKEGLIKQGAKFTFESIIRKVFLSRSNWLIRLVVPMIVGNFSSELLSNKKPEVLDLLKGFIRKMRVQLKNSDSHYDRSTVDEMDY